jgi:hypothetical protein
LIGAALFYLRRGCVWSFDDAETSLSAQDDGGGGRQIRATVIDRRYKGEMRSGAGFDDFDGLEFAEAGGVEGDGEGFVGVFAGGVPAGGFAGGLFGGFGFGRGFLGHVLTSHGLGRKVEVRRKKVEGLRQDQISKFPKLTKFRRGRFRQD